MPRFLKTDYFKAGVIYLILICVIYSPVIFFGKTLSASARFPWFQKSPPQGTYTLSREYPNTLNVDIAHAAASEDPMDLFIGKKIKEGVFPLWNPFIGCGTVIIEQFSNRTLFPYQLLQDIAHWSWRDFFLLGRLFIAAIGVFIFLKLFGAGFYPSLCGGIIYGFCGAMTVFLTLTEMSNAAMMMPYILLGPELINRYPGVLSLAFNSLAASLLILAGQPEVSFYGIIFSIAFFFFRAFSNKKQKRLFINTILIFVISLVLSFLISSPSFVPFLINSGEYYTLHAPGGTMGIETPTPMVNYMAAFLPELLRWRSAVIGFTTNGGWDYLGGYIGVSGVFIILASFRRKWWGRKAYLFFLLFTVIILLKNIGFPVVSWIGRLPLFNQVWTPRWTGPVWNLSLAVCVALGFQAIILREEGADRQKTPFLCDVDSRKWLILVLIGFLALSLGVLVNPLLLLLVKILGYQQNYPPAALVITRVLFIALSAVLLFKSAGRLNLSPLFLVLSSAVAICATNLHAQLGHIELPYIVEPLKAIFSIEDRLILFSMWQGMLESLLLGLVVVFALSLILRRKEIHKGELTLLISAVIVIEISFHVTLGYGEAGRFLRLLLHLAALLMIIFYSIPDINITTGVKKRIFIGLFFTGMLAMGAIGSRYLPGRDVDPFRDTKIVSGMGGTSRIMGIKGIFYPNAAVVAELQDIRSIVPISIKRFQLFQDYCLSAKPQGKYKSLWFTGIIDPHTGRGISEHLRDRHHFYSLAGVSNYFSPDYENIPHTELIEDGDIKNYRNLAAMPRVFMVYDWSVAETPEASLAWLLANSGSLASKAVVEDKSAHSVMNSHPRPLSAKVRIKEYMLHSVLVEVESDAPGLLILTDTYHPDWKVMINGMKKKIVPADLCFRGVFLEAGKNEVKFIYFPTVFYICVAVSFMVLSVLTVLVIRKLNRKAALQELRNETGVD
jgi:hypothetical protein